MKMNEICTQDTTEFRVREQSDGSWTLEHAPDKNLYICKRGNVRRFSTIDAVVCVLFRAGVIGSFDLEVIACE